MKIMVSAGEVSGDVHGAYLVNEIKKLRPGISFFGMGSQRLAAAGMDVKLDIAKLGTVGIFEALPNLFPLWSTFKEMKLLALQEKPDLVILIDSQGFNVPFAKFCKKAGLKTVYYVAPQEWLWGTEKGARKVAETVDLIIAIFQKEYDAYKMVGANAAYFGHPLIDIVKPAYSLDEARPLPSGQKSLIALCPGSRTHEIKNLLPVLVKAAELIIKELPDARFVVLAASKAVYDKIKSLLYLQPEWPLDLSRYLIVEGQTYEYLASSQLAICTSGTINFEAALLGTPNLMAYKLSPLTFLIGKYLLKIDKKIKYFSMPNILLDEKVIPELIQNDAAPENIARCALKLLQDQDKISWMKKRFEQLRQNLGAPGVISKIAAKILAVN